MKELDEEEESKEEEEVVGQGNIMKIEIVLETKIKGQEVDKFIKDAEVVLKIIKATMIKTKVM